MKVTRYMSMLLPLLKKIVAQIYAYLSFEGQFDLRDNIKR